MPLPPSLSFSLSLLLRVFVLAALAPTARATSVLAPTFAELVAESDTIVRGTVTAIRSEEFDSPSGRGVHTFVTFAVERTLKGAATSTVTLRLLGGTIGKRTLRVVGLPTFTVGQRQLVFYARNGNTMCPLIAAGHGRYHVVTDAATQRDYVTRDNHVPLTSTDQVSLPLAADAFARVASRLASPADALSLASFETLIADRLGRGDSTQQRP